MCVQRVQKIDLVTEGLPVELGAHEAQREVQEVQDHQDHRLPPDRAALAHLDLACRRQSGVLCRL